MLISEKHILLISPESWSHLFVSKHQYAIHLAAKGNKVYFLNPPSETKDIKLIKTEYHNLVVVDYSGFIRGLRFLPKFLIRRVIREKFNRIEKTTGAEFDIVWSFDNSVFFDFNALHSKVFSICHIVDLSQDFEFSTAAKTANLCIGVSTKIVQKFRHFNRNTLHVGHGCVLSQSRKALSKEFPGENDIKVFYAGNLTISYIDWGLISKLAERFKNLDFIFAGQGKLPDEIDMLDNCYEFGFIKSEELQDYLSASDVLLIAYRYKDYPDQLANPHKMMNYMASGKMIVSTWSEEYEKYHSNGLIRMYNDPDKLFKEFVMIIKDLDFWNSEEKVIKRRKCAEENTYQKQIERIEDYITKSFNNNTLL